MIRVLELLQSPGSSELPSWFKVDLSELSAKNVNRLLQFMKVPSNFASPLQFAGLILGKPTEDSVFSAEIEDTQFLAQQSHLESSDRNLQIFRVFFPGMLSVNSMAKLIASMRQMNAGSILILNFLSPTEVLKHGELFSQFGTAFISPYPELQCDVRMLNSAFIKHPFDSQAKHLSELARKSQRQNPQLRYMTIAELRNENGASSLEKVDAFFDYWQAQTNIIPSLPKRLLRRFLHDQSLQGGVYVDTEAENCIVSLNIFTKHPTIPGLIISTVNQNLRQLSGVKYEHLGVMSYLRQAVHILEIYPEASRVLIGGIGTTDGQQKFKRQFAMPGELWSYAVVFDPNNQMGEMNYQQKARIAHHVWE